MASENPHWRGAELGAPSYVPGVLFWKLECFGASSNFAFFIFYNVVLCFETWIFFFLLVFLSRGKAQHTCLLSSSPAN